MKQTYRAIVVVALSIIVFLSAVQFDIKAEGDKRKTKPVPAIRVAPRAPVINENERVAELVARRQNVAQKIGTNSIMILFSAEPRVYTNDVDYEYRQENNFYYLTNFKQQSAMLVLMPGNSQTPEILFIRRRNPANETWNGYMYSPQDAKRITGIKEIWTINEFEPFVKALKANQTYQPKPENILLTERQNNHASPTLNATQEEKTNLYLLKPMSQNRREYGQEIEFAAKWKAESTNVNIFDAWSIFSEMRLRKSAIELKYLQHAIDITIEAFGRSMAVAGQAKWEYEVEAEVEYTFKRRNADFWGYPSIVGCGPNATTLHYQESQGRIKSGDLLLMDVGAEYNHYTADVTRTFPVNGKFTPEQAAIYQIVYDAQEAVARATKPGSSLSEVHKASTEVIKEGLLKLGLITDKNSNQHFLWFMHGTSHWLGMNVHDVGGSAKFIPGAVFTNEPGIYIRGDALDYLPKTPENEKFIAAIRPAFEKYKNIGVRIEDDMLVTETGCEWMTKNLPRSIPEIESMIARASREYRNTASRKENQQEINQVFYRDIAAEFFKPTSNTSSKTFFVGQH
jgi:Xaa-Pro aminopeptidase